MMPHYRHMAALAAAICVTSACASAPAPVSGVEPEQPTTPVDRETPRPAVTPVRASFEYAPGAESYVVTTEATIAELDSVESAPRAYREVARLNVAITQSNGRTIVTTTGTTEGVTQASVITRFTDTLHTDGTDTIAEPRLPICGRDTVPPMHLVTLLPPVPHALHEGLRWQRHFVYAACQGSIPVRVERTDSYTVTGRAAQVAATGVMVSRSSSFAVRGTGVEGQHNVSVTGSGSAQAAIVLDATAGRFVSVREQSSSEISVVASGRTRRFVQRATRTVERQ